MKANRRLALFIVVLLAALVGVFSYLTWVQSPPEHPKAKLVWQVSPSAPGSGPGAGHFDSSLHG